MNDFFSVLFIYIGITHYSSKDIRQYSSLKELHKLVLDKLSLVQKNKLASVLRNTVGDTVRQDKVLVGGLPYFQDFVEQDFIIADSRQKRNLEVIVQGTKLSLFLDKDGYQELMALN